MQGSIEAIVGALDKLGTDEVAARVIHSGVGGITESDITLAEASGAAIIGFNVRAHKEARELAERDGIEIRYYNIIYDLVDDVKKAMSGLLTPSGARPCSATRTILEVFNVSKVGKVAGCRVTDGKVERGADVRLIRDNVVVHEGKLSPLKRFKDEARKSRRPGMRHGLRELPGHAAGRRHRMLPGGDGSTLALSPNSGWRERSPPLPSWPAFSRASRFAACSYASVAARDKPGMTNAVSELMAQDKNITATASRRLAAPVARRRSCPSRVAELLTRGDVHDPVLEGI